MRQSLIILIVLLLLLPTTQIAEAQRRKTPPRRSSTSAAKAAEQATAASLKSARDRVVGQIKTLTHFLYLLGGIAKGIEMTDQATQARDASTVSAVQLNDRNKVKVKESLRNVREGLEEMESAIRLDPNLRSYTNYVNGVSRTAQLAEQSAAANRFDEAGRSLLKVVNQLTDALAAMR